MDTKIDVRFHLVVCNGISLIFYFLVVCLEDRVTFGLIFYVNFQYTSNSNSKVAMKLESTNKICKN